MDILRLIMSDIVGTPALLIGIIAALGLLLQKKTSDTPAGVLTAGLFGSDETNARQSSGALATLVSTIELTGPGLDTPLPPGEVIEPASVGPPPEPAPLLDDAPPALETAFAPIEPGRYQVPNVGRQLTIDIDDRWIAHRTSPASWC